MSRCVTKPLRKRTYRRVGLAPGYRGVNPWSRVWWSRAAYITATRKQRKGDRGRREDQESIALKDIFLVTYYPIGPDTFFYHLPIMP